MKEDKERMETEGVVGKIYILAPKMWTKLALSYLASNELTGGSK